MHTRPHLLHLVAATGAAMFTTSNVGAQCELAKLLDADGAANDEFGFDLDLDEVRLIAGAPFADDAATNAGAAVILRRDGLVWTPEARLVAADGAAFDEFGSCVAVDGEWAFVAAPEADDAGAGSGAVYIFRYADDAWSETQKLVPGDLDALDHFGTSLATSGGVLVVGAEDDDDNGTGAGAAYVFRRQKTAWTLETKLLASDGASNDTFGRSVSTDGTTVVVGAPSDDDAGSNSGAAYVFEYDGDWGESAKLVPPSLGSGDRLGRAAAVLGTQMLVGAPLDDDAGSNAGAVYRFERSEGVWAFSEKLTAFDGSAGDRFGRAVDLDTSVAAVGAYESDVSGNDSGAVYTFAVTLGAWSTTTRLVASDGGSGDELGFAVAVAGDRVAAGAALDDEMADNAGAAYLFTGVVDLDCNDNGVADGCDIAAGTSLDDNDDGVPDECQVPGDLDGDGSVGFVDLLALIEAWGPCPPGPCPADLDGNGSVGVGDLLVLFSNWG